MAAAAAAVYLPEMAWWVMGDNHRTGGTCRRPPKKLPHLTEGNGGGGPGGRIPQKGVVGEEGLLGEAKAEAGIAAAPHWVLAHWIWSSEQSPQRGQWGLGGSKWRGLRG